MRKRLAIFMIYLSLGLGGCQTQRIAFSDPYRPQTNSLGAPVYEDHLDYYFLGLVGDNRIVLQDVCMDQALREALIQRDPTDFVFSLLTLGIYFPVTIKVWCGP